MLHSSCFQVIRADPEHVGIASAIMTESAQWLIDQGIPMWGLDEVSPQRVLEIANRRELYLAMQGQTEIGCFALQWEDPEFWPDIPEGESAFIHLQGLFRD